AASSHPRAYFSSGVAPLLISLRSLLSLLSSLLQTSSRSLFPPTLLDTRSSIYHFCQTANMKYAFVAFSALVASAMADQPAFLNSQFQVTEGTSFTLKFSGCASGCTIVVQTGSSNNLKDVETLTSSATGGSFTFTPSSLPSATYNFKITDNSSHESNYSQQFAYQGTGSTSAASTASGSTSAASTNTASSTAATATSATSVTTATSTSTSSSGSSTSTSTSASSTGAVTTKIPNSGAGHLSSPMALVAGAVAAMAYLG
ncbi:Uncharacterized protein TCAP_07333, partial [Tolypocladium capitatum]